MLAYDDMVVKSASAWSKLAFDVPFARAFVFGVPIGGENIPLEVVDILFSSNSVNLEIVSSSYAGHLFVEGLLLVLILFLISQKSYRPPKRPLTKKVLC